MALFSCSTHSAKLPFFQKAARIKGSKERRKGAYVRDELKFVKRPLPTLPQSSVLKKGHIFGSLWYVISHCSLYHISLSDSGAIALARALKQNKSLEELWYVGER